MSSLFSLGGNYTLSALLKFHNSKHTFVFISQITVHLHPKPTQTVNPVFAGDGNRIPLRACWEFRCSGYEFFLEVPILSVYELILK